MQSLAQQFAAYARAKPNDERFDYHSNDNCAVCQFLRDTGICSNPRAGDDYWREDGSMDTHPLPVPFHYWALAGCSTWGEVAAIC